MLFVRNSCIPIVLIFLICQKISTKPLQHDALNGRFDLFWQMTDPLTNIRKQETIAHGKA